MFEKIVGSRLELTSSNIQFNYFLQTINYKKGPFLINYLQNINKLIEGFKKQKENKKTCFIYFYVTCQIL